MKKKIIFINPPITLKDRYGKLTFIGSTMPSLGLCLLAAVAREVGWEAKIIDASSSKLKSREILKHILDFFPDYVAFTATTLGVFSAAELAKLIKADMPNMKIMIGGSHISALPEETMRMFPEFDIGVIGEGEETLKELLEIEDKYTLVKGLVIRNGKEIIVNPSRGSISVLDNLPFPAWDLIEGFPYKFHPIITRSRRFPAAYLITTRGCPNRCTFCDRSVFGKSCRSFSPEYSFEMIKTLYFKYGVREILFEDDTFFVFKNNIRVLCESILRDKLNLSWSCLGRVDTVDKDLLELMKQAGCWQIGYGIENGSQAILDFMNKKITLDQIRQAVRLTKEMGIDAKGFFILGFPLETHETIRNTIDFAKEIDLSDITVTQFAPLPGSEIYRTIRQYGEFDDDWQKMNLLNNVFIPKGLSKNDLIKYQRMMIKEFYLRPKIIFSHLRNFFYLMKLYIRNNKLGA